MRYRRPGLRMYGALCVLAVLLGFLGGGGALAHQANTYVDVRWAAADLPRIDWQFSSEVPTGMPRSRIEEANDPWDATTANLNFNRMSGEGQQFSSECTDYQREENVIYWHFILGGYAITAQCFNSNLVLLKFRMIFDSNENWYTGTGDPGPHQIDLLSTATHEFGHGAGWNHFSANDTCPTSEPYTVWETMCRSIETLNPPDDERGKKFRRNLETHDIHTYQNAY